VDRWRAGTSEQVQESHRQVALAGMGKAEGRFNAPLPSPSSYFGDLFELAPGNEGQIKEWREQVYKGYKGGPSIVLAKKILEQAEAEIVPQAELPERIRTRFAAPNATVAVCQEDDRLGRTGQPAQLDAHRPVDQHSRIRNAFPSSSLGMDQCAGQASPVNPVVDSDLDTMMDPHFPK
jgi:hypothetical protein